MARNHDLPAGASGMRKLVVVSAAFVTQPSEARRSMMRFLFVSTLAITPRLHIYMRIERIAARRSHTCYRTDMEPF